MYQRHDNVWKSVHVCVCMHSYLLFCQNVHMVTERMVAYGYLVVVGNTSQWVLTFGFASWNGDCTVGHFILITSHLFNSFFTLLFSALMCLLKQIFHRIAECLSAESAKYVAKQQYQTTSSHLLRSRQWLPLIAVCTSSMKAICSFICLQVITKNLWHAFHSDSHCVSLRKTCVFLNLLICSTKTSCVFPCFILLDIVFYSVFLIIFAKPTKKLVNK